MQDWCWMVNRRVVERSGTWVMLQWGKTLVEKWCWCRLVDGCGMVYWWWVVKRGGGVVHF